MIANIITDSHHVCHWCRYPVFGLSTKYTSPSSARQRRRVCPGAVACWSVSTSQLVKSNRIMPPANMPPRNAMRMEATASHARNLSTSVSSQCGQWSAGRSIISPCALISPAPPRLRCRHSSMSRLRSRGSPDLCAETCTDSSSRRSPSARYPAPSAPRRDRRCTRLSTRHCFSATQP